jgi:predicted dehydrogenase
MNPLRLALLGAGQIAIQSHLPGALACRDVVVTAIVDPVVERAASAARMYGIRPLLTADPGKALASVDAAIVATPNATHRDIALQCLEAGVHVLIEKPMTVTASEARQIVDAAARRGCVVAVGYATRLRPNVQLLKELLSEGYFGRVTAFAHQFGTVGGWSPMSGYNLSAATAGGGVLIVTGSHFLDRMLYLWGYPDAVRYRDDSAGGPEANCVASFTYRTGSGVMTGSARYSKTAALPGALVLQTELGNVVLADRDDADIVLHPAEAPSLQHVIRRTASHANGTADIFQLQVEDFVAACRGQRAPACDGVAGMQSIQLIESLYACREPLDTDWYGSDSSP